MTSAIIEAAARAMGDILSDFETDPTLYRMLARAAVAAVTPLIRAAALEEAAKVAEKQPYYPADICNLIAAVIRALKEQP
jgi:pantoate kinase